ncbi:hypothetical protein GCM10027187_72870 [Streptosporangium sandarakinum]
MNTSGSRTARPPGRRRCRATGRQPGRGPPAPARRPSRSCPPDEYVRRVAADQILTQRKNVADLLRPGPAEERDPSAALVRRWLTLPGGELNNAAQTLIRHIEVDAVSGAGGLGPLLSKEGSAGQTLT